MFRNIDLYGVLKWKQYFMIDTFNNIQVMKILSIKNEFVYCRLTDTFAQCFM